MLWETAEETWRRNSALIIAVKCCGRFITVIKQEKRFCASKANKSDQLAGGFEFYFN